MDYQTILTTCTYCGCGCNFFLEVLDGKLVGTIPCKTSPVNEGKLCIKGWNVHQFVQSEKRLTRPMIRKNNVLEPVSWDEALDYTASRLKAVKEERILAAKYPEYENYRMRTWRFLPFLH